MALYQSSYNMTCVSDFQVINFQPGEKMTSCVRVICTLISVSIISSWCNKKIIGRYLLFFSHWLSGLAHQLAEMVLAQMVLLCLADAKNLNFIKTMKFIELTAGNMLAVTNVAICVNLALIVSSHHTMSRVKSVTSPRLILAFFVISLLATIAAVPFWENVIMSGTLFWSVNHNTEEHTWVLTSIFVMELIAGVIMLIIVGLLVVFRWPELCQVWQLHRRIKFYMALTVIAIIVDLAIGFGGVAYNMVGDIKTLLIAVTWTMRHVHIALDTLVLYSALGVTTKIEMDSTRSTPPSDENHHNRLGPAPYGRRKPPAAATANSVSPEAV